MGVLTSQNPEALFTCGFQLRSRMVARAKSDPSISKILVHEFSRLSRNFLQTMALLPELK